MAVSLSNNRFSRVEIQSGLIGVGLINVEDRSGTLSLDKGHFKLLKAETLKPFSVECTQSLTHTSCHCCRLQQHREVPEPDSGHGGPATKRLVPVLLRHVRSSYSGSEEERQI